MVKQSTEAKPVKITAIEEVMPDTPATTPAEQFAQWVRLNGGTCNIVGPVLSIALRDAVVDLNCDGLDYGQIVTKAALYDIK